MRATKFQKVLDGVLRRMGLDPEVNTNAATEAAVAGYITERCREGWEAQAWPELTPAEERVYRRRWDDLTPGDIESGDVVYHLGAYWTALIDAPVTEPAEDAAEWSETTEFERYVALDQAGETPIGEVIAVWDRNPRLSARAVEVPFVLTDLGVSVNDDAPAEVWVEFTLRVPEFTTEAYDATQAYQVDDLVYFEGECYRALMAQTGTAPESDPETLATDAWERQRLPYLLARFVERAAYSDTLDEDGQTDKATKALTLAYQALDDERAKWVLKQGQTGRYSVQTAGRR